MSRGLELKNAYIKLNLYIKAIKKWKTDKDTSSRTHTKLRNGDWVG